MDQAQLNALGSNQGGKSDERVDPSNAAIAWAEVFFRNEDSFTLRDLNIVQATWAEATRRSAGSGAGDAAKREAWRIANPRWSMRWRIKKGVEQWQMVDDGEPWGQWGDYRKVIDAARAAHPGDAAEGKQQ
jgi:hypothetical protein